MAAPYTCETIKNAFYALTGQISPRLFNRISINDPWVAYVERGEWPTGMGYTINSMLLERTVTASETGSSAGGGAQEWTAATPSGSGDIPTTANNCLPPVETVSFGQTLTPFTMYRRNIQTENFCINDLQNDFMVSQVLGHSMDQLEFITEWVWSNHFQNEYLNLTAHNVVETQTGFNIQGTAPFNVPANITALPPTSRLLQGTLEQIYIQLVMDGAVATAGAIGKGANDQPIFLLFTDAATSRDLIRQDPDLRMDFRYADPDKLINTLGTPYSYNGFKHVWLKFPPRYDTNGNRVYPYITGQATTKGWKATVNPAYVYAAYQVSFVFIPTVFTALFERPPTNPGGGWKFNYASHMGDFNFLVILDKYCNPRGEIGFWDSLFAEASQPGHTYLGWSILHMNCGPLRVPHPSCYS
jgi:hypothetical protein